MSSTLSFPPSLPPSIPPSAEDLFRQQAFETLSADFNSYASVCWGDDALAAPAPTPAPTPAPESVVAPDYDPDDAWECPDLRLRKDIWTHFPVTVVPLGRSSDGAERHSVQWHRERLLTGRDDFDFDEYVNTVERRLFKALEASSKWDVLPKETYGLIELTRETRTCGALTAASEVCILRMIFTEAAPVHAPVPEPAADGWQQVGAAAPAPAPGPAIELRRLNDLRDIHCVWKTLDGGKIYSVQIHEKNTKAAGLDVAKHSANVLAALKKSSAWRVLPKTHDKELCRIELP